MRVAGYARSRQRFPEGERAGCRCFLYGNRPKRRGSKTAGPVEGLSIMGEEMAGQEAAKPRKRIAAKPPTRSSASKVKATIHLSVDASQRLDIHATMMGFDRSALVEKLIN